MSESRPSNQEITLDLSYLNDISGGSTEFMIEMIDIFLEQTPLYFDQLATAISVSDWKSVADAAHKIKPTLAFMGVEQAKDDMQRIEKNARSETNLDTIATEYKALNSLCNQLYVQLERYKTTLQQQP